MFCKSVKLQMYVRYSQMSPIWTIHCRLIVISSININYANVCTQICLVERGQEFSLAMRIICELWFTFCFLNWCNNHFYEHCQLDWWWWWLMTIRMGWRKSKLRETMYIQGHSIITLPILFHGYPLIHFNVFYKEAIWQER